MSNKDNSLAPTQQSGVVKTPAVGIHFSEPLPDADSFAKYESALPGAGDRILRLAENEQSKRHEREKETVSASLKDLHDK